MSLLSKVQVLVPMPTRDKDFLEFRDILLESILLFWPNHELNLMVVLDEEAPNVSDFSNRLFGVVPSSVRSFSVVTNPPPEFSSSGWIRQQQIQMWAGNFTNLDYVAFVDTDTLFVGAVLEESLFENGKPRILAMFGDPTEPTEPRGTLRAIGFKERFYGMCYFPVVVKIEHLSAVRNVISNNFGFEFNKAYDLANHPSPFLFVSQFSLIINVLYVTNHEDYFFHIRPCELENCETLSFEGLVSTRSEAGLEGEFSRPFPFVANHWSYEFRKIQPSMDFWNYLGRHWNIREVLRYGYCYSLRTFDKKPDFCKEVNPTEINVFEWRFESRLFLNQEGRKDAHFHRRALIETKPRFKWNREIVLKIGQSEKENRNFLNFDSSVHFHLFVGLLLSLVLFLVYQISIRKPKYISV